MKQFLAFDLGASSGRAMLGTLAENKITLQEMHRFSNDPVEINGGLFWNLPGLFQEMKLALQKTLQSGVQLDGIAIDTWGVDYLLLDKQGFPVSLPRHYRDPRTEDILPWTFEKISREEMYKETGIQFMNLNTVFQLAAAIKNQEAGMQVADKLLFMPNAFTYLFGGKICAEYSIASTSQLLDPFTKNWNKKIIDALGIPENLLPEVVAACSQAGTLSKAIQEELKCPAIPLYMVGSHDTASAVASVPADDSKTWAYLSSGTWSLLGVELDEALVNDEVLKANYTNEGGVGGKIRFLKNIMGLWLIQECRREWKRRGQNYSFDEIDELAQKEEPFRSLIDPNDQLFVAPGDMPERIAEYCRKTGQEVPETPGQIIRAALESLALRYRQTILELEELCGKEIEVLHLVGGGSLNKLLNQFTANAIQRPVVTGPVEATAFGNIIGQALASGAIKSLQEGRNLVKASIDESETFLPENQELWQKGFEKFTKITK